MSLNLEQSSGLNIVFPVTQTADTTLRAGATLGGLSGGATTYSAKPIGYAINGAIYASAMSGTTTPTTDVNSSAAMTLTASTAAMFVWGINSAGTIAVAKGPTVANVTGNQVPFPTLPSSYAAIAYHTVAAGSTLVGTFTFGSSNWNTTGITVGTVVNLAGAIPNAPVVL